MLLSELLPLMLAEKEMPVCKGTRDNWYIPAIADFRAVLGHDPTIADLTREQVNAWIDHRVAEARLSCFTIKTRRGAILAIWRAAHEMDLTERAPEKIRKVRMRRKNPTAWDRDEVQQLLTYALYDSDEVTFERTGLPARLFFGSLISAAYDTALRLGDLLSLEREWIRVDADGAGWIRVEQSKTGRLVSSRFNPSTMLLIDRLMACNGERRLIWPLWCRREAFYVRFRQLVAKSGIRRGTFRYLRRASATHVEQLSPGKSYLHAGHADPQTTLRHYLDAEQLCGAISPAPLATMPTEPLQATA